MCETNPKEEEGGGICPSVRCVTGVAWKMLFFTHIKVRPTKMLYHILPPHATQFQSANDDCVPCALNGISTTHGGLCSLLQSKKKRRDENAAAGKRDGQAMALRTPLISMQITHGTFKCNIRRCAAIMLGEKSGNLLT